MPISFDEKLLLFARTYGHTPAAERQVARFSRLGEHAGVWLVLGAAESLCARGERRSRWARAAGAVAGTYAANTALKLVVRRARPELPDLPPLTSTPTRFSFPSAHSSTSFAGALAYSRAGFPATPLYALAVGLALSRLYLGVHYPSDVLAGALFGLAIADVCTRHACAWGAMAAVDGTGTAVGAPGAAVDGTGTAVDAPGTAVDGTGTAVDAPGTAVDGTGTAVDGSGTFGPSAANGVVAR